MPNEKLSRDVYVSIIVLAKDCAEYIVECIGSMVSNTNIEIIIVDPGSSDKTSELVNVLQNVYPDKILVVRKKDKSPAEGLNNGMENVTGNIVGVLNGDDLYLPGTIKYVQDFFKSNIDVDVLLMAGLISNESTTKSKFVYPSKISMRRLALSRFGGSTFLHQGMFVQRSFVKDISYNSSNKMSWDFEYLVDLARKNPKVKISNKHAAIFRIHPDSISGGKKNVNEGLSVNSRISRTILGRQLYLSDRLIGIIFRIEKYLLSSINALCDTVFRRNRW